MAPTVASNPEATGRSCRGPDGNARKEKAVELERLPYELSVCKIADVSDIDLGSELLFVGKTDEEVSLVCPTQDVPKMTTAREDGWRAFRIKGVLDFSLTGILARISGVLAEEGIGIFAVSTYNTDYVLVKAENLGRAADALTRAGYDVD